MTVLARRIARLAQTGSPAAAVRATRRELGLRRAEAGLERGLAGSGPVVVGPFLGEVGYELLYWRPFVLRLLRRRDVDPARVTVIGRGGSAAWYGDVASHAVDAFELVEPETVRAGGFARPLGTMKQLEADALDNELLQRVGADGATVVHPRFMYWRMRSLWEGVRSPADAEALGDYDDLPRIPLSREIEARLPERYVVVKAYFNECVPDRPELREVVAATVAAIAGSGPAVLLAAPVSADAHSDWAGDAGATVVTDLLEPATNLVQQAEIVARADVLVSTYGGFSYLGPFVGVPTVAFAAQAEDNPLHEAVLRAVRPDADFTRVPLDATTVVGSINR